MKTISRSGKVLEEQAKPICASDYKDPDIVVYAIDQQGGKGGANYAEEVMPTLCSDSHGTPHAVAYAPITISSKQQSLVTGIDLANTLGANDIKEPQVVVYDARGNGDGESVSTITGSHENSISDYTSVVVEPVYCLQGNGIDRADTAGCNGRGWNDEACYTLNTVDRPAVAFQTYQKVTGPLMANSHPGSYNGQDAYNDMLIAHTLKSKANCGHREDSETYTVTAGAVRRLTPMECERLQGYPDGWTDIGDRVDSKGKKHKAADSPRYKALGNSIALPFWFWLLRRISAQYERPATLGSLFDGIGGFPLCWERCNGKGTAIWASEIEEFPMAVTRARFPGEGL